MTEYESLIERLRVRTTRVDMTTAQLLMEARNALLELTTRA